MIFESMNSTGLDFLITADLIRKLRADGTRSSLADLTL